MKRKKNTQILNDKLKNMQAPFVYTTTSPFPSPKNYFLVKNYFPSKKKKRKNTKFSITRLDANNILSKFGAMETKKERKDRD